MHGVTGSDECDGRCAARIQTNTQFHTPHVISCMIFS